MNAFKLDMNFLNSPIFKKIAFLSDERARGGYARQLVFIAMLAASASGSSFVDAKDLAFYAQSSEKQVSTVFDFCITEKILRPVDGGRLSAIEWMRENGLIFDANSDTMFKGTVLREDAEAPLKPQDIASESNALDSIQSVRGGKIQVRPNVKLAPDEITSLKLAYTEDQVERMYDRLSAYKSQSGRRYASDFDAIQRWVASAVTSESRPRIDDDACIAFIKKLEGRS